MTAVPSAEATASAPAAAARRDGSPRAGDATAASGAGSVGAKTEKGDGAEGDAKVVKGGKAPKVAKEPKKAKAGKDSAPKKKGSFKKIVILVVVLAGVGFMEKGKFVKPHYKPGQQAPAGQVLSLSDGSSGAADLTTSLSDGHLIQVAIDLQLTTVASSKTMTADVPQFLDAAVSVLSTETYAGMLTPSGQTAAKDSILSKVQQIAGRSDGAQQVSGVYFDSLVVQ